VLVAYTTNLTSLYTTANDGDVSGSFPAVASHRRDMAAPVC